MIKSYAGLSASIAKSGPYISDLHRATRALCGTKQRIGFGAQGLRGSGSSQGYSAENSICNTLNPETLNHEPETLNTKPLNPET